jgi:hypothetical protein
MFEKALFDGFSEEFGPTWPELGVIKDFSRGIELNTPEWTISHRQAEMELHGLKGHADALVTNAENSVGLVDSKAVGCLSYKRSLTNDLGSDIFAREYVGQLHAYRKGFIAGGQKIDWMALVYLNTCTNEVMFRLIDHSPAIDEEIAERLSWVNSPSEPTPDHQWPNGELPLRCGYCSQKLNCAALRGLSVTVGFSAKGKPVWRAA